MSSDTTIASQHQHIDDLNQQAWQARVNDSEKAFDLSQQTVRLSRELNYSKGLAEGLRSLGFGYVRLSKNDEAAALLKESLSLFQSLNDLKGQSVVYEYLGIVERNWGNLGASLQLLLKGHELIRQVGSPEIEITSNYQIGVTYKHLGNNESALDYLYEALSISKKIDFPLMEAYSTNIIGSIYFDNGNYDQALDCYQRGLVIRQQSGDKWGEAGSLDNIGITYLKLNDLTKAIDYCKKSLSICESTGDKKGEANALLHLAEIYQAADDIDNASGCSNKSLEIRKARGDKRGEAEVLLFLADLHKANDDVEDQKCFEWLSGALKIASEMKAQDLLSRSYYSLHEYYLQRGDYKRSLAQLESHLHIEKEVHKNAVNQKVSNLEISHKAEVISQRNKELTELNEQIEKANAELRVEASLERVRAVTMSMSKPGDVLNICKVMFEELQVLGFKDLRNSLINFWDDDNGILLDYDYSDFSGGHFAKLPYSSHPVFESFIKKVKKATDAFAELVVTEEELETWKQRRRNSGEYEDPRLNKISALYYYFYSTGVGALGISTFSPVSKENLEVLKRFRNVFDLTYRRYHDIVKAEAQAREAQIEAALERVRASSMAMHHSDDLISVINVVKEQLIHLGFHFHAANFATDYSDKGYTTWLAAPNESFPTKIYVPSIQQNFFKGVADAVEKGLDFTTYTLSFEEKNLYFKNLTENSLSGFISEEGKKKIFEAKGMAASVVLLNKIRLNLMNLDLIPYTDEENNILKRIAYVFEQSYIRFLDLQKAEAQAKEAQIELALERVRAKAMAMQGPIEFVDVIKVIGEQFIHLDFDIEWVNFGANGLDVSKGIDTWNFAVIPGNDPIASRLFIPYFDHPLFNEAVTQLDNYRNGGNDLFVMAMDKEDKDRWLDHLFTQSVFKDIPVEYKAIQYAKPGYTTSNFALKDTWLSIGKFDPISFTVEQQAILRRFGKAFGQAYTRFLDLQKAEAQARESQIQLALERVRARTMAMQKSDELREVVTVVFEQLLQLGFTSDGCAIILYNKENLSSEYWMSLPGNISPQSFIVPYFDHPYYKEELDSWEKKVSYQTFLYEGELKKSFEQFFLNHTPLLDVPADVIESMTTTERAVASIAFMDYGSLSVMGAEALSDADAEILQRFTKVFDQTYTRFLDLQKAEAQAKEARIEAALEKVRSRSLAMQKSEELKEVIQVVYEQFVQLNVNTEHTGFVIDYKTREDRLIWVASKHGVPSQLTIPYFDSEYYNSFNEAKDKGWDFFATNLSFEDKNSFYRELFKYIPGLPQDAKEFYFNCKGLAISTVLLDNVCLYIENFEGIPYSDEDNAILMRFGKVFQQTYTRFLDLQKAEAQVREAQIETGLERVRSKTMAMHKSEEVTGIAISLNEELLKVGFRGGSTIIIIDKETGDTEQWTGFSEDKALKSSYVPYFKHPIHDAMLTAWKNDEKFFVHPLAGDEKRSFDEHYFATGYKDFPENDKQWMRQMQSVIFSYAFMKYGAIHWGPDHLTQEQQRILQRFAKVFEQSYTRFLDLQKAEAQTREAQIEVAVERVRAKALAMHKSEDLHSVVVTLKKELMGLQIPDITAATMYLAQNDGSIRILDLSDTGEDDDDKPQLTLDKVFRLEDTDPDLWVRRMWNRNDDYFVLEADEADFVRVVQWLRTHDPAGAQMAEKIIREKSIKKAWLPTVKLEKGVMNIDLLAPPAPEIENILLKMGAGFDLAYKRFLDLQKAEAQAREAQIELGLERVRARAMAMQKSSELKELIATVSTELSKLDLNLDRCFIMTYDLKTLGVTWWMANPETPSDPIGLYVKYHEQVPYLAFLKAWHDRIVKWQYILEGSVKKTWDEFLFVETELSRLPSFVIDNMRANDKVYLSASFNNFGCLTLATLEPLSDEQFDIMLRFAKVFDLTYTRFNDLKQAEAQTREAQIETALERVRSASMAMHTSDELQKVIRVLTDQLTYVGFHFHSANFITNESMPDWEIWISSPGVADTPPRIHVSYFDHILFNERNNAIIEKKEFITASLDKEQKDQFFNYLFENTVAKITPAERKQWVYQQRGMGLTTVLMKNISLSIINYDGILYSVEENEVIKRFAKVFEQSYTRFLDLQKAEAQAREAQIETGLERVRSRSLAMHNTSELQEVIHTVHKELLNLNIAINGGSFIAINSDIKSELRCWGSGGTADTSEEVHLPLYTKPFCTNLINRIKGGPGFFTEEYTQEEKKEFFTFLFKHGPWSKLDAKRKEETLSSPGGYTRSCCVSQHTSIFIINHFGEKFSVADNDILQRFGKVFEQSYTRFLDLQKAEAQAREAQIELGLERVRAKAMAMQNSDELNDLVAILFEELTKLDLILARCIIWIFNHEDSSARLWMANSEDKDSPESYFIKRIDHSYYNAIIKAWKKRTPKWVYHLQGEEKRTIDKILLNETELSKLHQPVKDGILSAEHTIISGSFNNFGLLEASGPFTLTEEQLDIIHRFSKVFDLTYTRFNDLKLAEHMAKQAELDLVKLKEEKKRAEDALTELQATQRQLVQSEKMASLGEMTAGIAHEIQNPLNFVNNFSDVSNELLEEMKTELASGNTQSAIDIVNDVKDNLEKILHHGKRADAIVKSMLQHSRSSSGKKEPTDINSLTEEYLRLAFHGLRAKDKSFNAKFETNLDQSIGNINVIPQDIGRVILNLINNAFYAVSEKKNKSNNGYEPTVLITTKKINDKIELKVKDNGEGISPKVLDKIFQPFFTTKPTGQGTGLGLSLSYDIITKGHGGDIKVETKEGEGSEFIISLPAN